MGAVALLVVAALVDLYLYALARARVAEIAREVALVTVDAPGGAAAEAAARLRAAELVDASRLLLRPHTQDVRCSCAATYARGGLVTVQVTAEHRSLLLGGLLDGLGARRLGSTAYALAGRLRNADP